MTVRGARKMSLYVFVENEHGRSVAVALGTPVHFNVNVQVFHLYLQTV